MRMYDIIEKKRDGLELTKQEIEFFVNGYSNDTIPDYQVSALLMAIYLNKLTNSELKNLTLAMANSSKKIDLSSIKEDFGCVVDKHSTGGVGDKVTLIVLPILAALGVKICKMSGRGLGYTGGTIDKLESIVGYNINIPIEQAINQVQDLGVCLIGQSSEVALADKKIYALRDVTATVSSIDLIASSIMSKKIASGVNKLVLDVTVGSGAFMQNITDAKKLAKTMVDIGKNALVDTIAVITDMEQPLGRYVGNALEIKEVISFLLADETTINQAKYRDLKEVVFEIAAQMLKISGAGDDINKNKLKILECITSKKAYDMFIKLLKAQGGHIKRVFLDYVSLELDMPVLRDEVKYLKPITSEKEGYIVSINSKKIGEALVALGGGRNEKDDMIDYAVGFEFIKKVGDKVKRQDTIFNVLFNDKEKFEKAYEYLKDAIYIGDVDEKLGNTLKHRPTVIDVITGDSI